MTTRIQLTPHPEYPPSGVTGVDVTAEICAGASVLVYRVSGDMPLIPEPAPPARTDELWKHSCFELFVKPAGDSGYFEFNFSPSSQWAAYRFDGYRSGMAEQPLAAPTIAPIDNGVRVEIDLGGLPRGAWQVAITAVIEERDGTKSYWSAAQPDGKPDFHAPENFVVQA